MNSLAKAFKYLTIIYCVCTIYGCDDSIEVSRVLLTTQEKNLFPYSKNQKIEFVHSKGYQFQLIVSDVYYKSHRYYETESECPWCREARNYVLYEMKHVILTSTYPKLTIEIDYGALSNPFVDTNDSTC